MSTRDVFKDQPKKAVELGRAFARMDGLVKITRSTSMPEPSSLSEELRHLSHHAECLYSAAWSDNPSWFFKHFSSLRSKANKLEPAVERLKNRLAVAAHALEIKVVRHNRKISSAHIALFEYCREPIFITWLSALHEECSMPGDLRPVTDSDIEANWPMVSCALIDNWDHELESYISLLDAEIGSVEEMHVTSSSSNRVGDGQRDISSKSIDLRDNQKKILETLARVGHPLNSNEFLAALDDRGLPSSSHVKQQFSFLVQIGELVSTNNGYALPRWESQS